MRSSYHHGNLKTTLLDVATKIIKSGNGDKLTIRHLASECQVSSAAAYRHYKNKNEILEAIATRGFAELTKLMQSKIKNTHDDASRLLNLGTTYVNFAIKNPELFRVMFSAMLSNKQSDTFKETSHENYNLLIDTIKSGLASGEFQGNTDAVILGSWATVHGLAVLIIDKAVVIKKSQLKQMIQDATITMHRGILASA